MKKICLFLMFPMFCFGQSISDEVELLFQSKKYAEAENKVANYLVSNTNDFVAIELLGDAYGYQKKWDEAIDQYKKLVDFENNNANYHYKYGGALGMKALTVNKFKALGIIGDVKDAFLKASELDSEHIDVRWAMVELYMQLPGIIGGSKSKSLKYANELEELSQVDGYLAKGYIYEYEKEADLAETYYKKAIEVAGSITCYDKLTSLYQAQGQPQKAMVNIENAYEKHNKNQFNYQIGKVSADYNIELNKGERCLKMYIKNYTAKDGVPLEWAYFRLAQIQKNRKHKIEALEWIDKALDVRSDFKEAKEEKKKILAL